MNDFYKNAGIRIRELRENNDYSREQLAELAEISPKFLYEIENGCKGFSAITLYHLANALSVRCEYILTGDSKTKYNEALHEILNMYNETQMNDIIKFLHMLTKILAK